jgi:uncharacterized protein (DUF4415 family)
MRPKPDPELIDDENPEWTDEDFARAVPFSALPPGLQQTLTSAPHHISARDQSDLVPVLLREEVVEAFRSSGPGWEERINGILGDWLADHSPDDLPQ